MKEELAERDGARCLYCRTAFAAGLADATLDHLMPYSRFPRNLRVNLVLACYSCNQAKGARPPHEFLGLSATDLAARVGVCVATIERVMTAPTQAPHDVRNRVLAALRQRGTSRALAGATIGGQA